jgi:hypothetical protein
MVNNVAGPIEANPAPHLPFMVNDDERVLMFRMEYDPANLLENWFGNRFVNLFVHQHLLLNYARQALTMHSPLDIPWADWGPPNTRLIESSSSQYGRGLRRSVFFILAKRNDKSRCSHLTFSTRRYVHGQRVVFTGRNIGEDGQMVWPPRTAAYIFDFSLAAVLSAKGALEMPSSFPTGKPGTLLPPSVICAETVPFFLEDVETYLPCVMSTLEFKVIYPTYMIYADGIVGIHVRPQLLLLGALL